MGAVGMVLGMAIFGHRLFRTIGTNITKVTPIRGFTMQLSGAIAVMLCTLLQVPVSSTHCLIGAVVGIGAVEGCQVNWWLFVKIAVSWVVTIGFAFAVSSSLFTYTVYTPTVADTPVFTPSPEMHT